MLKKVTIADLMGLGGIPIADVRTPAEFAQGHIPGAFNLPLFSNEERVQVGTTYKQQSREAAILLGFDLAGPKWSGFIRSALALAPDKKIVVHCWRGGMRSGAMAWALDLYGFQVYVVEGGYKRYRRWVLDQFGRDWSLVVLGGMTGSGKTRILHELERKGEQVVDLEDLAQHQGSTYGTLNRLVQPSQEQFENDLAARLLALDRGRRIWVEDESRTIGQRLIPRAFWDRMRSAVLFEVQPPPEARVSSLTETYGMLDRDFLVECTERIRKRLGPEQTKRAVAAIREGRMEDFVRELLVYYDKTYRTGMGDRVDMVAVPVDGVDAVVNSAIVLTATLPEYG
ncbi:MAG TPA: tRNA 2-selenouridine(34) synthase MnmH [Dinghuibacter sp.]|uniref:tRNA 2-selenouridine(34) synthase MnmH n=1 Tax=Dinghuibacter sp. TaxID=2024697 RepID=UPI002CBC53E9|nr:tRNA 2-selenouridine(34) synthase MnmH [Dinghuibacter sp.]HTJ12651.1 tRNA 2-selenouridine(34) synthase MnmH [Dinghuibacter sp.]